MPQLIQTVQMNGSLYVTDKRMGTPEEREFYTVMTERWGKLYFDSKGTYYRWCRQGRRRNNELGRFLRPRQRDPQRFRDEEREGLGDDGGGTGDDMVIIEEYVVEDCVAGNDASETSTATATTAMATSK